MGRAPKRTFRERANPLNVAAVEGAVTTVQAKEEVPALLKKLNSAEANDRVWAAASASNLVVCENPGVRRLLLANNVISALIERLSDSVPDVVVQASGALRNLAAIDQGAAEEMARKNIFAAIQSVVPRLAQSIDDIIKQNDDGRKLDTEERKVVFLTADNLISILWALSETVPPSIKLINSMGLTPFLVSFFNVIDKLPASLVQTAGQFLYTMTDNSDHSHRALLDQPNAIITLFKVVEADHSEGSVSADDLATIRILAGGILANTKPTAVAQLTRAHKGLDEEIPEEKLRPWEELPKTLLQVISQFIAFDMHAAAAHAVESIKGAIKAKAEDMANGAATSAESGHEVRLDRLDSRMNYLQLALELAANIFTDEGADEGEADTRKANPNGDDVADLIADHSDSDQNMDEDDDDMDDGDEEGENDNVDFDEGDMADILADESTIAQNADEVVQHSILGLFIGSIVPSLQRLTEPTIMSTISTAVKECNAFDNEDSLKTITSTVENFVALHERALASFNNFLLVVEESLRAWFRVHTDSVDLWWRHLIAIAEHIFGIAQAPPALFDVDQRLRCTILETTVGCMWTLARGVDGAVPVTAEQIEGLVHVCETAPAPGLRVKAVGVLGNIARRQPGFVNENRRIGAYLLENIIAKPLLAAPDSSEYPTASSSEPIIEALDLFYDIYSDMGYDYDAPVFVHGEFLNKLRQLYIPTRKLVKSIDRRKHRGLRDRGDLAVQNMRAFIDYKTSELKEQH
ncbi:ARM repeat-containing protein [Martensiomyces pterosporus]|nr:ARM repeat-containing protein [Martensiomyces pterosporus]